MTDREKAIVMAYTGIAMLVGDKINEFYKYLAELYGRPVYTHELVNLDIASKAKSDFIKLCQDEHPERKKGKWIEHNPRKWGLGIVFECSECGEKIDCETSNFCPNCGADMTEGEG